MSHSLTFDAIAEARPGAKWKARWDRSWPAYEAWFRARGGDAGPSRAACEAALRRYMPELVPMHADLASLVGDGNREARFLSGWCPPAYLGGCSVAALSDGRQVRLVRNYDLSPDLNEGLLFRSEWRRPVMGMIEFLWGLSDGINDAGLSVALAYGGSGVTGTGFGITTIVRNLLETCDTVTEALERLGHIPSHMAYNLALADRAGRVASVELAAGGGLRRNSIPIATNHQEDGWMADRPGFTRTLERRGHLETLLSSRIAPGALRDRFLQPPLFQRDYSGGFGTLFTAEYDPGRGEMVLAWPSRIWRQSLSDFCEDRRHIEYSGDLSAPKVLAGDFRHVGDRAEFDRLLDRALSGSFDWISFGRAMSRLSWTGSP